MLENSLFYVFSFPVFASESTATDASFPYSEPRIVELLTLTSFLFLLNVARVVADYFLHGGIIAEITLGMVYGRPLAAILPSSWEETFTVLGYLGLIGIVFEGGLSTELSLLVANLPLSVLCALTGIGLPVALSFALMTAGFGYRPLESFAAGAALSSTSLGTTLMALNSVVSSTEQNVEEIKELPKHEPDSSESVEIATTATPSLHKSRIGTVLISAAVIDDVIGLVLASLIPALSVLEETSGTQTNLAWTIIKPILSSSLMALVTPIVARFVLRPIYWYRNLGPRWCMPRQPGQPWGFSWFLKLVSRRHSGGSVESQWGTQSHADSMSVSLMILVVSAFATVAFYTGSSVLFGAYLAGLTITYITRPPPNLNRPSSPQSQADTGKLSSFEEIYGRTIGPLQQALLAPLFFASIGYAIPFLSLWQPRVLWRGFLYAFLMGLSKLCVGIPVLLWGGFSKASEPRSRSRSSVTSRLKGSAYPALFIGTAMVARGEIGLLIAQLARTESSSSSGEGLLGDEAFLVCIWAILLCTLFSPIGVGYIVQRMRHRIVQGIWA